MSLQTWVETVAQVVADQTAVTGTSETILVPDTTIPASYLFQGRSLRARLAGKISNVVTSPGNMTWRCRWGGVGGTVLAASAALSQNIIAQTDDSWMAEWLITCREGRAGAAAATGKLYTQGILYLGNLVAASAGQFQFAPATGNAEVGSLDLTAATALSFTLQFGTTGNSCTVQQFTLESMN